MSTLICFALREEAAAISWKTGFWRGHKVLLTGIGKKNAERTVRESLAGQISKRVLTCGFAGGLDPALKIGDVVFATDDAILNEKLSAAGAKPAKIHCADRVAVTVAEKQDLRKKTGADAVEMESGVIQSICRERGIPCATVRVISDTANDDLPLDFNALSKPDQSLDFGKLAFTLVKQPGKIPALMRLQKNCQLAAQRLAEVLDKAVR